MPEVVHIDLPPYLDGRSLRRSVAPLPLVFREDAEVALALTARTSKVALTSNAVQACSADGIATLMAFDAWLRRNVRNASYDSDVESTVQRLSMSSRNLIGIDSRVIVARRMLVPAIGRDKSSHRNDLRQTDALAAQLVRTTAASVPLADRHRAWLFEFLMETLLNVSEHSEPHLPGNEDQRIAWIAIRRYLPGTLPLASSADGMEDTSWREEGLWHQKSTASGDPVLDVAVVDCGQGIPQTLASAFRQRELELGRSVANVNRRILHSRTLEWALSPFGTSKNETEFFGNDHLQSWRGLYRTLYRTAFSGGYFQLSSGCGSAFTRSQGNRTRLGTNSNDAGVPWTSVTASVQLSKDLPSAPGYDVPLISLEVSANVVVGLRADLNEEVTAWSQVHPYVLTMVRQFKDHLANSPLSAEATEQLRPVLVIHPAINLRTERVYDSGMLLQDGHAKLPSDQVLWALLKPLMIPGLTVVHACLDDFINAQDVQQVQEYIHTLADEARVGDVTTLFGLQGIYLAREGRIHWITSVRPALNLDSISKRDKLHRSRTWKWRIYTALVPQALNTAALPSMLGPSTLKIIANQLIPLLVTRQKSQRDQSLRWYWKSTTSDQGVRTNAVRLSNGLFAFEYLNTHLLCEYSNTFFFILKEHFFHILRSGAPSSGTTVVVATTEVGSQFILEKLRLEWKRDVEAHRAGTKVEFLSPRDEETIVSDCARVVVFSDFSLTNTTLQKRLQLLREIYPENWSKRFVSYISVWGGRSESVARECQWISLCEYKIDYADKVRAETVLLSIDPLSNELISAGRTSSFEALKAVRWDQAQDYSDDPIAHSYFEYGLRYVSQRYFICRWPVDTNLAISSLHDEVALAVVARVRAQWAQGARRIFLVVRPDSTIQRHLTRVVSLIRQEIRKPPATIDPSQLRVATLAYRDSNHRRVTDFTLESAIKLARPFTGEAETFYGNGSNDLWEQMSLLNSPDTYGQLGSGSEPAGGGSAMGLIFFDNSVVTGRTIDELTNSTLALTASGRLDVVALDIYVLVSRLNPLEEGLRRLATYDVPQHAPSSSRPMPRVLKPNFQALLQLRIASYKRLEDLRISAEIDAILRVSEYEADSDLRAIRSTIASNQRYLRNLRAVPEDGRLRPPLVSFFVPQSSDDAATPRQVSLEVVQLRQLLSLYEQGIPCAHDILRSFRLIVQADPNGLIHLFALEPNLINEHPTISLLSYELASLCHLLLRGKADLVVKTNSLWVLAHLSHGFDLALVELLANSESCDQLLQLHTFFLKYHIPRELGVRYLHKGINTLSNTPTGTPWLPTALQLWQGELYVSSQVFTPRTVDEARAVIENYLRRARSRHGVRAHAAWFKIAENRRAGVRVQRVDDTPGLLAEAELWLRDGILPTLHACRLMLQQSTRHALHSSLLKEIGLAISDLPTVFRKFAMLTRDGPGPHHTHDELDALWQRIETMSAASAVDSVFGAPQRYRNTGVNARAPKANEGSIGLIERVLPIIASEVCFAVTGRVASTLDANQQIRVIVSDTGEHSQVLPGVLVADLNSSANLLERMWSSDRSVRIIWGDAVTGLDEALSILLDNILKYADPAYRIEIEICCNEPGTGQARVRFSNVKARNRPRGKGNGLKNITECLKAVRGSCFELPSEGAVYRTEVRFDAQSLTLRG